MYYIPPSGFTTFIIIGAIATSGEIGAEFGFDSKKFGDAPEYLASGLLEVEISGSRDEEISVLLLVSE